MSPDSLTREAASYKQHMTAAHNNGVETAAVMLEVEAERFTQNPGAHIHLLELAAEVRKKKL